MKIKHSKYKNTGILFELLVRQITSDTLSGKDSKAALILKKYFVKTELGKEYKLYETLSKYKNLTESSLNLLKNSGFKVVSIYEPYGWYLATKE
jgi:DNA polymerase III delta prime subunit